MYRKPVGFIQLKEVTQLSKSDRPLTFEVSLQVKCIIVKDILLLKRCPCSAVVSKNVLLKREWLYISGVSYCLNKFLYFIAVKD